MFAVRMLRSMDSNCHFCSTLKLSSKALQVHSTMCRFSLGAPPPPPPLLPFPQTIAIWGGRGHDRAGQQRWYAADCASQPSTAAAALQLHVFTRSHSIMHSLLSLASSAAAAAAGLDSSLCLQSLLLLQLHLLLLHVNTEPVKVRL